MKDKKFSRNCPKCSKIIYYKDYKYMLKAESRKNKCRTCTLKETWKDESSLLNKEVTRLKRNKSVSDKRKDPNSAYNTEEYREKFRKIIKDNREKGLYDTEECKNKASIASKECWKRDEYRDKVLSKENIKKRTDGFLLWFSENHEYFREKLKLKWTYDRKEKARQKRFDLMEDEEFKKKFWNNKKIIRVSKLELDIKENLEKYGFVHSSVHKKTIGRYSPDFINEDKKIVLEIHGDYWHCNPNIDKPYSKQDYYHSDLKMTSLEKWQKDKLRTEYIESYGYKVYIIWEDTIHANNFNILKIFKDININLDYLQKK